jgi:hypothetical protein
MDLYGFTAGRHDLRHSAAVSTVRIEPSALVRNLTDHYSDYAET